MSVSLYRLFIVIALFRIRVLLISKRNEQELLESGGKEYGKIVSKLLAIFHTLFYFCALFEGIYKKVQFDSIGLIGTLIIGLSFFILIRVIQILGKYWTVKIIVLDINLYKQFEQPLQHIIISNQIKEIFSKSTVELYFVAERTNYIIKELLSIGMPVFFLVFTAMIKLPNPEAQDTFMKEYLMSMTTFSLTSFSIFTFPFEIIEDKKNGWRNLLYRLPVTDIDVFIVKVIKMIIFFIISIILVFLVGFLVRGIHLTLIQWLMSGLLLLIGAIVFLSLGTILTNFKDEKNSICIFKYIIFSFSFSDVRGIMVSY